MNRILSLIIMLLALADLGLGFGFLVNPVSSAAQLGVAAQGPMGASTIRADFTAFFLIAGAFMIAGAWRLRGSILVAPLGLFLVAFSGRLLDVLLNGPYPGSALPMAYEMGHVALLGVAISRWPWLSGRESR